jgi:hypothetical protein
MHFRRAQMEGLVQVAYAKQDVVIFHLVTLLYLIEGQFWILDFGFWTRAPKQAKYSKMSFGFIS